MPATILNGTARRLRIPAVVPYTRVVGLHFNEAKATQAAACFLRLRGGKMSYIKLIKLLYLLDREALLRWGRTVTTDRHVSMDKGPVVSQIYDLIREEQPPGSFGGYWRAYISAPQDWEVRLLSDPPGDELSRAEESLIEEIYRIHGTKSRWELVRYCHDLPEWRDPEGSALPISYTDILRAGAKPEDEIAAIDEELRNLAAVEAITRHC